MALGLLVGIGLTAGPAAASGTYTAVASGDWTSPATWAGGATPPLTMGQSDFVEILEGNTVTISSSTTVTDGGNILNRGGLIVAGTLDVQHFLTDYLGSLTVSAGGAVNVGGVPTVYFQNTGSTVINHGSLNVRSGGTLVNQNGSRLENAGTFQVFDGATINNRDVSRIVNDAGGAIVSDAGAYILTNGQIENRGSYTNQSGSTTANYGGFTSVGSVTNHGTFEVLAGGFVNAGGSLSNDGSVTVYASNAFLNLTGGTIVNLPGGTVTVRGATQSFVNQGSILNESGATFLVWTALVNNHGVFANHGALTTQNVASITNDASGVITNYADGTIANGQFSVIENGDAAQGFGSINSYGPVINDGQLQVAFGTVHQYAPGAITNSPTGRITISGSGTLIIDDGATLTNARFGSISNGGLLQTILGTIQNHGTIDSIAPGFLLNGGTVLNYCADGATVTGRVANIPVQAVGCTTTFTQAGIPSASWGVTANGTHYAGTGPSVAVGGLSGTVTYAYDASIITAGARYDCVVGCSGSVSSGGTVSATYAVRYRVTYQTTGCALPVPVPPDQFIPPGSAASSSFPSTVASNDDPPSVLCVFVADDRPATISGPTTITGTYLTQYLLSVYNGASSAQTYYAAGTPVVLTADAVPHLVFVDWEVDGTAYPPLVSTITITMNGPHIATAVYDTPLGATQRLQSAVDAMGLAQGTTRSLDAKLNAAIAAIGRGSNAAVGQLSAFRNEVRAQTGKTITSAQAGMLADAAGRIIAALGD